MKKLILLGLCIFLFVSMVSAATYKQTYKQNVGMDLVIPCSNNDTFCSSSATCNLTILKPDEKILIEGKATTNKGTHHSYLLTEAQTSNLGRHRVIVSCQDGSENGFSTYPYWITETGEPSGEYRFAIYLIILLGWLLFIIGAYKTEYTFVALAGIILLISGVYVLINGLDNFNNTLTTAFGGIHALFGAYLMIRAGWEQYKDAF